MANLKQQQQHQQPPKPHRQKHRPSCRNAMYLSLACSLLGVASAAGASSPATAAAFAAPSNSGKKSSQRRERTSFVRLFSSLPLTNANNKKSLQHPDQQKSSHLRNPNHSPNNNNNNKNNNKRGHSELHSAATLVLDDYISNPAAADDPFDPSFRPPSWEDTWGPPPKSSFGDTTAALPVDYTLDASASQFRVFCDLDGVLCDFEHGVQTLCRKSTSEIAKTTMWQTIAKSNVAFFETLQWTREGPKLWNAIRHLNPDILTGVPDLETAREEKVKWCQQNLGLQDYRHVDMAGDGYNHANVNGVPKACKVNDGPITNIITCWSYNKHHESGQFAVLIDDRIALKDSWEAKGGIFVHHTGDVETTLQKLDELGVPIATTSSNSVEEERDLPRP